MHIKNSNNNKMRKIKVPSHNIQNNFLAMHIMQKINTLCPFKATKKAHEKGSLVALLDTSISRLLLDIGKKLLSETRIHVAIHILF
jgi:hypothetical protein